MMLLRIVSLLSIVTTGLSAGCLFEGSDSTLNAAAELALSASTTEDGWTTVHFGPPASRRIPREVIDGLDAEFFNGYFNRRQNSHSYLWASATNGDRTGAVLAHLVTCTAEMYARADDPRRHTVCTSSVNGNQAQLSLNDRCDIHHVSNLLLSIDNNFDRGNRTGTTACWCDEVCSKATATFEDKSSGSSKMRNITSFVVLMEDSELPAIEASVYENGKNGNNKPGRNWYQENLVEAHSPVGKGIFPQNGSNIQGRVLRSLRIRNVLEQIAPEESCEHVVGFMDNVELRMMAKVEEQMSAELNRAIAVDLRETPAKSSDILLTIASSVTAVLVFGWHETAGKGIDRFKAACGLRQKLFAFGVVLFVVLLELAVENLPIYFLLFQEVAAKKHKETIAMEIVGSGNQIIVLPNVNTDERFLSVISALVLIIVRNSNTSVTIVAIGAAFLSVVSIGSVALSIRKRDGKHRLQRALRSTDRKEVFDCCTV